jgi:hypothetical protein
MIDVGPLIGDKIESLMIFFTMQRCLQLSQVSVKKLSAFFNLIEKKEHQSWRMRN